MSARFFSTSAGSSSSGGSISAAPSASGARRRRWISADMLRRPAQYIVLSTEDSRRMASTRSPLGSRLLARQEPRGRAFPGGAWERGRHNGGHGPPYLQTQPASAAAIARSSVV